MDRFSGDDDEVWATAHSLRIDLRKVMMQKGIPSGVLQKIREALYRSNDEVCDGCGEWRFACDCDRRRDFD